MNFKKIAITAAAAGVMLSAALPALAHGGGHWSSDDLNLDIYNDAWVTNTVITFASTGFNQINGSGGDIDTGNATALGVVTNDVNTNIIDLCDCLGDFDDVDIDIDNGAWVTNTVITFADTGFNWINGSGGDIDTGNAGATSVVGNVVNSNIVGDVL